MSKKFVYLDSGLSGYWNNRQSPELVVAILKFNYLINLILFGLLGILVLLNLTLITVSFFILAIIGITFLELNLEKYPVLVVPFSQITLILVMSYLHLTITDTLPTQSLYPNFLDLLIAIFVTFRLFLELFLVRRYLADSNALNPETKANKTLLNSFFDQLKLTEPLLEQEFQEPSKSELSTLIIQLARIIAFLFLTLIPLGLVFVFKIIIYPYIILIPSVIISLFLIIIHSRKGKY
ncbi:MAG: hypothetical protein ACW98F_11295 [Candidatus Hodarchaeales archaeon]|jgi:hypothetical protein